MLTGTHLAYAIYFDQQRRKSPDFRRELRRQERRQQRAEKEEAVLSNKAKSKEVHSAVDRALEEGFPSGVNEREGYFMEHVQEGEILAQDRESPIQPHLGAYALALHTG